MANNITVYVVSAICGNFWQESGIDPGVWENLQAGNWTDLLKGYGLGQWTNTGGDTHGRLYKLHEWLSQNGYADDDFDGQLAYIEYENVWYRRAEAYQFQNLQDFLTSQSTDLTMLTHAWNMGWFSFAPSNTGVATLKPSAFAAKDKWISNTCPIFIREGTPNGFNTISKGRPFGKYGISSTGSTLETTPLLP